jgi:RNA polymerase sigma factor (sigma-70 family)
MLVLEPTIQNRLVGIVNGLTGDRSLREDLMQEAMVHIWKAECERPNQSLSWYLQGCSFHLRHYLASGRSIDSCKRRTMRIDLPQEDESSNWVAWPQIDNSVTVQVEAHEIINLLPRFLTGRERAVLQCLLDGLQPQEIALRLHVSHPTVAKDRRRIAGLAGRLTTWSPLDRQLPLASSVSARNATDHSSNIAVVGPLLHSNASRPGARIDRGRQQIPFRADQPGKSPKIRRFARPHNSSRRWEGKAA